MLLLLLPYKTPCCCGPPRVCCHTLTPDWLPAPLQTRQQAEREELASVSSLLNHSLLDCSLNFQRQRTNQENQSNPRFPNRTGETNVFPTRVTRANIPPRVLRVIKPKWFLWSCKKVSHKTTGVFLSVENYLCDSLRNLPRTSITNAIRIPD